MPREPVDLSSFRVNAIDIWLKHWFLLTAGTPEKFNCMTVAWGSIGGMWHKPFVQVVVRPTRYTYEFMNQSDDFTLSAFPDDFHKALMQLGSVSGRDTDKIEAADLTPEPALQVQSPTFAEDELVIECRKIYWQDMQPENFMADYIGSCYSGEDYHRIFFGEILAIEATRNFMFG